jgi:hypothetical protein
MADTIKQVEYFYVHVPDRPGEAARALRTLEAARVNLLAFSGFPEGRGGQLDFIPANPASFRRAAQKAGWKVTGPKRAFLVRGTDRVGAGAGLASKLAAAGINITALDAVCAGAGRYGALLWVDPRDVRRAARVLGAR